MINRTFEFRQGREINVGRLRIPHINDSFSEKNYNEWDYQIVVYTAYNHALFGTEYMVYSMRCSGVVLRGDVGC